LRYDRVIINGPENDRMQNSAYHRVAVAIDDSPAAQAAMSIALSIVAPDGELAFIHAIDRALIIAEVVTPYGADASPAIEAFEQDESNLFVAATAQASEHHIRSTTYALDGRAQSSIADFVRKEPFDAIVIGTRAHHGVMRVVLGSTADSVLRAAPVPTFVTSEKGTSRIASGIRHLLVAVDGSQLALTVVQCAIALAQRCEASLTFAHVAENDPVRDSQADEVVITARDLAARAHVQCNAVTVSGSHDEALNAAASAACANLIVIGTHGYTGFTRLRLGSVAESVIRTAKLPVMVVPASAPIEQYTVPVLAAAAAAT
jgi:nucleotide-binding universal stress UspA family protein